MNIVEGESKKRLEELLKSLEKTHSLKSENWKSIIEENKEEFDKIKVEIKEKQVALTSLVKKKKAITISDEEFDEKSKKIQQELYELEKKILKLRLQNRSS